MGGEAWYGNYNQLFLAEAAVLGCLVTLAVLFERLHGAVHHYIHGVSYGLLDLYKDRPVEPDETKNAAAAKSARIKGANYHYTHLFNRMNEEFMVLGFLAFCVWSCNQAELFKTIGEWQPHGYWPDESSLLHLCEDVHMFLFTAMLTNFGVCALAIHSGMLLQLSFGHWERELLDFNPDPDATAEESAKDESKISEIGKERWKIDDPKCCSRTIKAPGVLTGSLFADIPCVKGDWSPLLGWHRLEKYFMGSCKSMGQEIHRDFDFSRYISACLDQVMEDVVIFQSWTWLIILAIFSVQTIICATKAQGYGSYIGGSMPDVEGQLTFICMCVPCFIFAVIKWTEYGILKMARKAAANDFEVVPGFMDSLPIEVYMARLVQALVFLVCYQFARLVCSKKFWSGELMAGDGTSSLSTFWNSAFYLLTVIAIWSFIVFYLLPKFLFASTVYYAMPPHIDEDNKATIKACASYAKCTKEEKEEEETEKKLEIAGKFQSMMEMGNVKSAKVAPHPSRPPTPQDTIEDLETAPLDQVQPLPLAGTSNPLPPISPPLPPITPPHASRTSSSVN